mmetsp:Transcript_53138/g.86015  ORF Transcript_53138/g.86015 Transcript_53138/m.86015 type:complete len:212 (+) Transcript_53138:477-1112(+)
MKAIPVALRVHDAGVDFGKQWLAWVLALNAALLTSHWLPPPRMVPSAFANVAHIDSQGAASCVQQARQKMCLETRRVYRALRARISQSKAREFAFNARVLNSTPRLVCLAASAFRANRVPPTQILARRVRQGQHVCRMLATVDVTVMWVLPVPLAPTSRSTAPQPAKHALLTSQYQPWPVWRVRATWATFRRPQMLTAQTAQRVLLHMPQT